MNRQRSPSPLEAHVGYWLRFVSNHVSQAFSHKVDGQGVTVAEWVLLRELLQAEDANPSQLAERLGMTRGAISKLVERLCRKQLVSRSDVAGDRRYQTLSLTASGRELVPVLARLADDNDREFFGHLSAEQKAELITLLRNIVRQQGWKDTPVD